MTDTLSARPDSNTIGAVRGLTAKAARQSATPGNAAADPTSGGAAPPAAAPSAASAQSAATIAPTEESAADEIDHSRLPRLPPPTRPATAAEAAAWYALRLGWPIVPGAPVLAVLGSRVPGAVRLGAVDVPALVGTAALERLGKAPGASGPITDGQGRIRFLVDLGEAGGGEHAWLEDWRAAGVDLRVAGSGEYCPLPTPGMVGRSRVVWTVPPDPVRPALPGAREITAVLDRAVRDAYPALWHVPTRAPS